LASISFLAAELHSAGDQLKAVLLETDGTFTVFIWLEKPPFATSIVSRHTGHS
jgi:hypothetical protein